MKDFTSCFELARLIETNIAVRNELNSYIRSPGKCNTSGIPKSKIDKDEISNCLSKLERYDVLRKTLEEERKKKWKSLVDRMHAVKIPKEDIRIMRLRYFYGLSWNKVSTILTEESGTKWDVQKLFRHQRKIKKKLT